MASGQYVSSDSIGLEGGFNTFGCAEQSSLLFRDFNGLCPMCELGAAVVIGAAVYGIIHTPDIYYSPSSPYTTVENNNSGIDQDPKQYAKGGKQNIDNEYVREVQNLGSNCQDPCEYLKELYDKEIDSDERKKIKTAMKRYNCDGKDRWDKKK